MFNIIKTLRHYFTSELLPEDLRSEVAPFQRKLMAAIFGGKLFAVVPGAAATKPPPPVIFCQVGVSHIYVTASTQPVIFIPTRVSHICSGGSDFRKLQ